MTWNDDAFFSTIIDLSVLSIQLKTERQKWHISRPHINFAFFFLFVYNSKSMIIKFGRMLQITTERKKNDWPKANKMNFWTYDSAATVLFLLLYNRIPYSEFIQQWGFLALHNPKFKANWCDGGIGLKKIFSCYAQCFDHLLSIDNKYDCNAQLSIVFAKRFIFDWA